MKKILLWILGIGVLTGIVLHEWDQKKDSEPLTPAEYKEFVDAVHVKNPELFTDEETPDVVAPKATAKAAEKERALPGAVVGTGISTENIFNGVNRARYDAGLPILKRNAQLDAAAQMKLDDEISKGYFAHVSPEGYGHQHWIELSGYVPTYEGENLARDFSTTQSTVDAWIASPTHYANIVKPGYTETGVAVSGSYVVQIFAAPHN